MKSFYFILFFAIFHLSSSHLEGHHECAHGKGVIPNEHEEVPSILDFELESRVLEENRIFISFS